MTESEDERELFGNASPDRAATDPPDRRTIPLPENRPRNNQGFPWPRYMAMLIFLLQNCSRDMGSNQLAAHVLHGLTTPLVMRTYMNALVGQIPSVESSAIHVCL